MRSLLQQLWRDRLDVVFPRSGVHCGGVEEGGRLGIVSGVRAVLARGAAQQVLAVAIQARGRKATTEPAFVMKLPVSSELPCTDTKPQGSADFYFAINATFRCLMNRPGHDGWRRYLEEMGRGYFAPTLRLSGGNGSCCHTFARPEAGLPRQDMKQIKEAGL